MFNISVCQEIYKDHGLMQNKQQKTRKPYILQRAGTSPFLWPRRGTLKTTQATMAIIVNTLQVTQQEEGMGGNHTNIHGAFGDGQ